MRGKAISLLVAACLMLGATACTRLPQESQPGMPGSLPVEILDNVVSIPAAWGSLSAVSNDPLSADITRLWIEDEEGTIRLVSYNNLTSRFYYEAVVIRRH